MQAHLHIHTQHKCTREPVCGNKGNEQEKGGGDGSVGAKSSKTTLYF